MIRGAIRRALMWALRPDPAIEKVTGEAVRLSTGLRARRARAVPVMAFLTPDQPPILTVDAAPGIITTREQPDPSDSAGA